MLKNKLKVALMLLTAALGFCSPASADEKAERRADTLQVQNLLARRDFPALEQLAQQERERKILGASGIWRLQHFYGSVDAYFIAIQRQQGCQAPLPFARIWLNFYPHSPTAIIVIAKAMDDTAFCYRGGGYASEVGPEAWAKFNLYEHQASDLLTERSKDAQVDPEWYAEMEVVATALNADTRTFLTIFKEGTAKFPLYYQIYDQGMIYFAPRWHGSKEDAERFAKMAAEQTRGLIGDDMYARLYWYQSDKLSIRDLHTETAVDWDRMKASMHNLVEHHPDPWNLENLARIACQSGDVALGAEFIKRIQPAVDSGSWERVARDGICDRDVLP